MCTMCARQYVIVTDCSPSLTTDMIQIPAWACEKVASDFSLGSEFWQNCNRKVNIYNKEMGGKIIFKKGNEVHKQSKKK